MLSIGVTASPCARAYKPVMRKRKHDAATAALGGARETRWELTGRP